MKCPAFACHRQSCEESGKCYLNRHTPMDTPCADTCEPGHGWERVNTTEQQTAPAPDPDFSTVCKSCGTDLGKLGSEHPDWCPMMHLRRMFSGPVLSAFDVPPAKPETILEEAARLTSGDRNDSYDHPYYNFSKIAKGWSILLGIEVTPHQVGLLMIWMKLVRENHRHKRDNITDIAGYARTIEMIDEYRV